MSRALDSRRKLISWGAKKKSQEIALPRVYTTDRNCCRAREPRRESRSIASCSQLERESICAGFFEGEKERGSGACISVEELVMQIVSNLYRITARDFWRTGDIGFGVCVCVSFTVNLLCFLALLLTGYRWM